MLHLIEYQSDKILHVTAQQSMIPAGRVYSFSNSLECSVQPVCSRSTVLQVVLARMQL